MQHHCDHDSKPTPINLNLNQTQKKNVSKYEEINLFKLGYFKPSFYNLIEAEFLKYEKRMNNYKNL